MKKILNLLEIQDRLNILIIFEEFNLLTRNK
jgi:hypothetical protein